MKKYLIPTLVILFSFIFSVVSCASPQDGQPYESGMASWYGKRFHGRKTASGEKFNMNAMTAAHPRLKFGTKVKVVEVTSGKSVIVRINDRGPHTKKRVIDLSKAAAKKIGLIRKGTGKVNIYLVK